MNRKFFKPTLFAAFCVVLVTVVGASVPAQSRDPYGPIEPKPSDDLLESFEATVGHDQTVEFRWQYTKQAKDQSLNCSLNFDGDALADEQIPDCANVHKWTHRYEKEGRFQASLLVRSRSGGGDMKTVVVKIGSKEDNPS